MDEKFLIVMKHRAVWTKPCNNTVAIWTEPCQARWNLDNQDETLQRNPPMKPWQSTKNPGTWNLGSPNEARRIIYPRENFQSRRYQFLQYIRSDSYQPTLMISGVISIFWNPEGDAKLKITLHVTALIEMECTKAFLVAVIYCNTLVVIPYLSKSRQLKVQILSSRYMIWILQR
jgi:hypothetical protein